MKFCFRSMMFQEKLWVGTKKRAIFRQAGRTEKTTFKALVRVKRIAFYC